METFSAGSSIRFGWETFKKRPWYFAGVTLLIALLMGIASGLGGSFGKQGVGAGVGAIINFMLSTFIGLGVIAFFLKAHDEPEHVESGALWHPRHFWSYLAASVLTTILIALGFILLIVPGIVLMLMLLFTNYLIVDRGMGPIEAMKESARIATGHKWRLLGLLVLLVLIDVVGALCLVVGLLVSVPVTMLALVHAYRTLSNGGRSASVVSSANG